MKSFKLLVLFIGSFLLGFQNAGAMKKHTPPASEDSPQIRANAALKNFVTDNKNYYEKHPEPGASTQTPRSTVVLCSDSRCQTQAFDVTPVNDIFEIRNIGNQFLTSIGSVKYGVEHLHPPTPLLMFIGHSRCGAIKAATEGGYLPPDVLREIRTLKVKKGDNLNEGILDNVHDQVEQATHSFKELVEHKKLTVVGAVFDFANDFNRGNNRLIFINVNGEQNPEKLKKMDIFKGIENPIIGISKAEKAEKTSK